MPVFSQFFDNIIGAFSPERALARHVARERLKLVRGGYEGARTDHRGSGWRNEPDGANTTLYGDLVRLRARSRSMVRNNPLAKRAISILTAHTVGTGLAPRWPTASTAQRRRLKAAWDRFADHCDARGQVPFAGLLEQAVRGMFEGGETLALRQDRRKNGEAYRRYLLIEGDQLDHNREGVFDGRVTRLGVALDRDWHEIAGYWLFDQNPADAILWGYYPYSHFVPAEGITHLYRIRRPGQMRGVPELAASLPVLRDIADYMESSLVKARIEACFAGFITSEDSAVGTIASRTDQRVKSDGTSYDVNYGTLTPGTLQRLSPGEKISFAQPSASNDFTPFTLSAHMQAAAGAGVTYDQISGDLRQANYSSLRAGKIEFRREIEMLQHLTIIPQFCKPIYRDFVSFAQDFGSLTKADANLPVDWVTPAWEPIDPRKDLEADILAVRSGRLTWGEFVAAWGRDPHDQLAEIASFNAELDRANIVLDTDPRKVSAAGLAQPQPGTQQDS